MAVALDGDLVGPGLHAVDHLLAARLGVRPALRAGAVAELDRAIRADVVRRRDHDLAGDPVGWEQLHHHAIDVLAEANPCRALAAAVAVLRDRGSHEAAGAERAEEE